MSYLTAQPGSMTAAAADLDEIRSAIGAASSAAAGRTTSLVVAARDEVSAATAALFNTYAEEYQAVVARASFFHEHMVQLLAGSGLAYAETEIVNAASSELGALTAPFSSLLGVGGGVKPAASIADLVLGASGYPIPWQIPQYITEIPIIYLDNLWNPGLFGAITRIPTPEGLYPLTGIKGLTFDVSAAQGVMVLDQYIKSAIASGNTQINVFGYSQSANIVSQEMMALNPTNTPGGSLLPRYEPELHARR